MLGIAGLGGLPRAVGHARPPTAAADGQARPASRAPSPLACDLATGARVVLLGGEDRARLRLVL